MAPTREEQLEEENQRLREALKAVEVALMSTLSRGPGTLAERDAEAALAIVRDILANLPDPTT